MSSECSTREIDQERGEVHFEGRTSRVAAFPLGIPVDYFEDLAASSRTQQKSARIRRGLRSEVVVLGVDRLDYTKGILERLLGFERFLERNPNYHRRVTLVLIAVPSRTKVTEYAALKRQLDEAVGRVVGRFSSDGWVPIRYLYTQFGAEDLVAHYQAADIALLTPLRDGMNLVAKEFVASHPADDAVLILSEFAGAAEEMTDALLVNPYNTDAIADRIREALEMRPEARADRMRALREKIRRNNLERWSANFLTALTAETGLEPRTHRARLNPLRRRFHCRADLIADQLARGQLLLCLDFDGTISELTNDPWKAVPLARAKTAIAELARYPEKLTLAIISGRDLDTLLGLLGLRDGLLFAGTHGLEFIGRDGTRRFAPGVERCADDIEAGARIHRAIDSQGSRIHRRGQGRRAHHQLSQCAA